MKWFVVLCCLVLSVVFLPNCRDPQDVQSERRLSQTGGGRFQDEDSVRTIDTAEVYGSYRKSDYDGPRCKDADDRN